MRKLNNKGQTGFEYGLFIIVGMLVSIATNIVVTGQVEWPNFKAKAKTVDTVSSPAPSPWLAQANPENGKNYGVIR